MAIVNCDQKTTLAEKYKVADTFFSRFIGLLNRSSLDSNEALVLTRCQSIHMFFMRFSIDVIFVNNKNVVVGIVENIKPFQMSRIFFASSYAVELPSGKIQETKTAIGNKIKIS